MTLTDTPDALPLDTIRPGRPRMRLVRVPIIEPLDIRFCWEHMPLDYYCYGEYPRFLSPPRAHGEPRYEWGRVPVASANSDADLTHQG